MKKQSITMEYHPKTGFKWKLKGYTVDNLGGYPWTLKSTMDTIYKKMLDETNWSDSSLKYFEENGE